MGLGKKRGESPQLCLLSSCLSPFLFIFFWNLGWERSTAAAWNQPNGAEFEVSITQGFFIVVVVVTIIITIITIIIIPLYRCPFLLAPSAAEAGRNWGQMGFPGGVEEAELALGRPPLCRWAINIMTGLFPF